MNWTFLTELVAGIVVVFVVAYVLLEFVIGPRARARESARLDALIKPIGPEQYRYVGQDDTLRVNTKRRREIADARKREAAQIASGKPVNDRIHLVVNG